MTGRLRRALVTVSILAILACLPVVAGFMAGIDQPPRTELSIYEGAIENGSDGPRLDGIVYLLEGEGVVVRGVQVEVLGSNGDVLVSEPIGRLHGTTKVDLDVSLPHDDVTVARLRLRNVDGARSIEVYGLTVEESGQVTRYEESSMEYEY